MFEIEPTDLPMPELFAIDRIITFPPAAAAVNVNESEPESSLLLNNKPSSPAAAAAAAQASITIEPTSNHGPIYKLKSRSTTSWLSDINIPNITDMSIITPELITNAGRGGQLVYSNNNSKSNKPVRIIPISMKSSCIRRKTYSRNQWKFAFQCRSIGEMVVRIVYNACRKVELNNSTASIDLDQHENNRRQVTMELDYTAFDKNSEDAFDGSLPMPRYVPQEQREYLSVGLFCKR